MSNRKESPTRTVELRPRITISEPAYLRFKKLMQDEVRKTDGELISAILEQMFRKKAVDE